MGTSGCTQETITVPTCTTSSGPETGKSCVFPFRYNGIVYSECTSVDQSAAWCATEVDAGGNFISNKYGFCPSSCPSSGSSTTTTTTSSSSASTTTTVSTTTTASSSTTCTTSSGPAAGQP